MTAQISAYGRLVTDPQSRITGKRTSMSMVTKVRKYRTNNNLSEVDVRLFSPCGSVWGGCVDKKRFGAKYKNSCPNRSGHLVNGFVLKIQAKSL